MVCKRLSLNGYGWICLTISGPNRICKKFGTLERALKVRILDSSGVVTVEKGGWEREPRQECGVKGRFSGPGIPPHFVLGILGRPLVHLPGLLGTSGDARHTSVFPCLPENRWLLACPSCRRNTKKRVQPTGRALRSGSRTSLSFSGQPEGDHRGRGEDGGHRPDHRLRGGDRGAGLRLCPGLRPHGGEAWGDAVLPC